MLLMLFKCVIHLQKLQQTLRTNLTHKLGIAIMDSLHSLHEANLTKIVIQYILLLMSRVYRSSAAQNNFGRSLNLGAAQLVHCPVCNVAYPTDQTDAHIQRHNLLSSKFNEPNLEKQTQPSSRSLFAYPIIEPLQFQVGQIVRPQKKQIVTLGREQRNKVNPKVIEMIDRQTQTINRPFLQFHSEERDLYNCFDDFFNGGSLKYDQVIGKNVGLATKRNLNEWQENRVKK